MQDCEFTYLSTQILHLLGVEGPKTKEPAKYIRFIYNRIILENATVRAAAVSSLAKFGALVDELRPRIRVLLSRALHDNDDEVCTLDPFLCSFKSQVSLDAVSSISKGTCQFGSTRGGFFPTLLSLYFEEVSY